MASELIRLAFVGDVMLGRKVNELLRRNRAAYPWGDTLQVIRGADWRCANLECVLCDPAPLSSWSPKVFHFRADASNVAVLEAAGIDAVSLANNHSLDFGRDAMLEMLRTLDIAGIAHSGAGANLERASQSSIGFVKGLKIGLISFTDNESKWEATAVKAGIFYVPIEKEDERTTGLLDLVRQTRGRVDCLVVAAHWGSNWGYKPNREHTVLAHKLIDVGADLIFGHSPHVCRGIEIYKERPIFYSAGDYIDDYAVSHADRNDRSFLFFVELEERRIRSVKLVPTVIRNCQALIARDSEAEEIATKMIELCTAIGTQPIVEAEYYLMIPVG